MKRLAFLFVLLAGLTGLSAQRNTILDTLRFRTLQVQVGDNPFLPPVVEMGKAWHLRFSFDEMSHDYRRLRYHIDHCEADWSVSEELFESDFLSGLNDELIEDCEKSFNTVQTYTHYHFALPNRETRLTLSGNYRVTVYEEDDEERTPLLTAEFCLLDQKVSIAATVSDNTDIDFQQAHQQVSLNLNYGSLHITDPVRELKTFVMQNRRTDRIVQVTPNLQKGNGAEFTHQRSLIFPGGGECHSFEVLDVRTANFNVDRIQWFEPYYHVTLIDELPTRHYSFLEDHNGAWRVDNDFEENPQTTSEYAFVHFRLRTPRLPGGEVYVYGNWTNRWPSETYRMAYDEEAGEYHAAVLLKQGFYEYRFLQLDAEGRGVSRYTDGDFYQTRNDYQVLVYYREPGGRTDRLVGYTFLQMK